MSTSAERYDALKKARKILTHTTQAHLFAPATLTPLVSDSRLRVDLIATAEYIVGPKPEATIRNAQGDIVASL